MKTISINADSAIDAVINNPSSIADAKYLQLWNEDVQAQIDADIETNRKANARITLSGLPAGTQVQIEQVSHDFKFGAHIFNFDQLGSDEYNARYKELYGTLFNSATVAFYWRTLEPEQDRVRFAAGYEDSAAFWNSIKEPYLQPHWRRPAPDPVVDFCEQKNVRIHGHTLTWGNAKWQHPDWVKNLLPACYRDQIRKDGDQTLPPLCFEELSDDQLEALLPEFTTRYNTLMARRILQTALRYKDRIHSWDVVNESASDFGKGLLTSGSGLCKSWYGLMPGDYACRSFKIADSVFPPSVKLYINDYNLSDDYLNQVQDMLLRNCRIDAVGAQMHLFDPQTCQDITDGKSLEQSPERVWETMSRISRTGLPLHLSEITITAPGGDERGQRIQALITRNLYRLWFSIAPLQEITWWNVVDNCGAPGEPSVSGLFTRDMRPKASYHVMEHLLNSEWKTKTTAFTDSEKMLSFRGFRGRYRLTWQDKNGKPCSRDYQLG